jgi:hypothetical protein
MLSGAGIPPPNPPKSASLRGRADTTNHALPCSRIGGCEHQGARARVERVKCGFWLQGTACSSMNTMLNSLAALIRACLIPLMQWGLPDSAGHYLDLLSAVLGLALFSIGYLWHAIAPIKR